MLLKKGGKIGESKKGGEIGKFKEKIGGIIIIIIFFLLKNGHFTLKHWSFSLKND